MKEKIIEVELLHEAINHSSVILRDLCVLCGSRPSFGMGVSPTLSQPRFMPSSVPRRLRPRKHLRDRRSA